MEKLQELCKEVNVLLGLGSEFYVVGATGMLKVTGVEAVEVEGEPKLRLSVVQQEEPMDVEPTHALLMQLVPHPVLKRT